MLELMVLVVPLPYTLELQLKVHLVDFKLLLVLQKLAKVVK